MKRFAIITALVASAVAPLAAHAQTASEAETELLGKIATCLAEGLPPDWRQAEMIVELPKPGAQTGGNARYLMMRNLSGGQYESFSPCDEREAARQLVVELRKLQTGERRNWKGARFVVYRNGKFDLTLDYAK